MDENENKFTNLRNAMVNEQLIPRGIRDGKVLDAMRKVPRHLFVPKGGRDWAYDDGASPIGAGQTISQPYMVAIMTELLELKGGEKVLEIGTGSGYQAAILAELAGEVLSMERIQTLADGASKTLSSLGYDNVSVIIGDGTEGLPGEAPFDGIIVTAGCPDIPAPLIDQLKEGGRIVVPVGERTFQVLTVGRKKSGKLNVERGIGCVFVPLVGKYGWPD